MIRALYLSILMIGLVATTAVAGKDDGTKVVKAANDAISQQLKKKASPEKVTASVRDFVDLDELGKRALGDHWAKLKPAEQKEYLEVLRGLIEANYIKGMKANVDYKVDYTGETAKDDGTVIVTTTVKTKRKGRPLSIAIDYTLMPDAKGKLRVIDISTDGVGLVANYRAQFGKIIDKDGITGLIAKMKKKQAEAAAATPAPAPAKTGT
jgi:phospholipid transport system substrate-binding protein